MFNRFGVAAKAFAEASHDGNSKSGLLRSRSLLAMTAALPYPSHVCGEGGHIVSGANDVTGGVYHLCASYPHPALRATLPTKIGGGMKTDVKFTHHHTAAISPHGTREFWIV